jgi:HK97 family phage major capsid protein
VQATEEILEDAPTVRGYIDTRLGYMLMLREEAQVIGVGAGGGNAPNLKGILDFTTGIQTASGLFYDMVASAIGKIENVDGDPDGVVANPVDYWAAVADRHATFYDGNAFGSGGAAPFGAPQLTAWGLPVVRSRSITSGTALVGSWALGATLFEREGVSIRTTDSHASLFVSNTWIILAEERVGLAVHRPDFFVKGTVTAPS